MATIGVGGVIFNECQQVLLIQRNKAPASGYWSVPGGRLEPGESLAEACRREVKEETGLDVAPTTIVAVVDRRLEGFHYVIIDYLALLSDEKSQPPIAHSDVSDARWVNVDQISAYDLVEGLEEIILRTFALFSKSVHGGLHDPNQTDKDYILQKQ
ncbi:MAG: NUDIX hydrolase [Methylococcaceae bacterium]|nr:NUDIX hydrolase [Methylococcaceae bacterium]